jgi:hypothetical protein
MKLTIENGLLYADNKRICYAKVNDDRSQDVQPVGRKVSTQYSHAHGKILPLVADYGWIGDDEQCAVRIGSVLGNGGPIKCAMSISGLVARIEACEEFGTPVLIEIK